MPRQNRVTPFGEVVAVPERGTFMGNRGVLHDDRGQIRRSWQAKRWILCLTEFKNRQRSIMSPGHYTELFFLDEATGLAAGHRPCAECQRQRFNAFRIALTAKTRLTADEVDAKLHRARVTDTGEKRRFARELDELPDGVFVQLEEMDVSAWLRWKGHLLKWSPGGYTTRRPREEVSNRVFVLTPEPTVAAIRAGFVPVVHASALT